MHGLVPEVGTKSSLVVPEGPKVLRHKIIGYGIQQSLCVYRSAGANRLVSLFLPLFHTASSDPSAHTRQSMSTLLNVPVRRRLGILVITLDRVHGPSVPAVEVRFRTEYLAL
jgi:hypothetical protein